MPIIVYISFFVLGLFFFPLMLGHLYMTCRGLTTAEMLKQKWKRSEYFGGINPWSQKHWYQNIYARLLQRWPAAQEDPLRWLNSRYYYGVTVAAAVEDQKVDWLLALPPEERKKVEENDAAAREAGAKIREEQEAEIVRAAMEKRGFHVA
ncbi:DHHC palmitoyltransferase [Leishmania donovani]|nr:DHHC palmitoyltransferase [Leishmania donovani]VDZ46757.1 DHHC_palmitoyltransferase_putative/Pfam:PF01529 [Leishmania donovani]